MWFTLSEHAKGQIFNRKLHASEEHDHKYVGEEMERRKFSSSLFSPIVLSEHHKL